jgi:hypothetical protein
LMVFIRKTLQWSVLAIKTWNFHIFCFFLLLKPVLGSFTKF